MRVKLFGIQRIDFTVEETGERIQGYKLHVASTTPENDNTMRGLRCATVFTKLDEVTQLVPDSFVDLVYQQVLGSNKARLVAVNPIK